MTDKLWRLDVADSCGKRVRRFMTTVEMCAEVNYLVRRADNERTRWEVTVDGKNPEIWNHGIPEGPASNETD